MSEAGGNDRWRWKVCAGVGVRTDATVVLRDWPRMKGRAHHKSMIARDGALPVMDGLDVVRGGPAAPQPVVVCRRHLPLDVQHRAWARQIAPIVARLVWSSLKRQVAEIHVTAVEHGDGASTVARQIAHTAARLGWCRVLLLDVHPEPAPSNALLGGSVPNLTDAFAERHLLEVAAVECTKTTFHAAALRQPETTRQLASMETLRTALAESYDLIINDCPPVLDEHFLAPVAEPMPRVVLVLQGGRTRISMALRAKQEIAELGGELFGAVLTRQRSYIPRWLDWAFG
jgi:Mrp family chromosome partitioning ATPase